MPSVSQSTLITAAVLAAFFVYITSKGELPQYLATLWGSTTQTGAGTVGGTVSGVVQSITGTPGASVRATVN